MKDMNMALSDKTRKLLWGLSGARCSICRRRLVLNATETDSESVVGEECHIHARHEGGARRNAALFEAHVDAYENLILLCREHHKVVDDQSEKYTADYLRTLKSKHEAWVDSELRPNKESLVSNIAIRVSNGTDVVRIVGDADGYDFQHDELETEQEVETVGDFLQDLQDYMVYVSATSVAERTKFSFATSQQMKELDGLGFAIFIGRYSKTYRSSTNSSINLQIAVLRVMRKTNPTIQTFSDDEVRAAIEELTKVKQYG